MLSSVLITFHKTCTYEKVLIYSYLYTKDKEEIIHNPDVSKVFLHGLTRISWLSRQLITDLIIFGRIWNDNDQK